MYKNTPSVSSLEFLASDGRWKVFLHFDMLLIIRITTHSDSKALRDIYLLDKGPVMRKAKRLSVLKYEFLDSELLASSFVFVCNISGFKVLSYVGVTNRKSPKTVNIHHHHLHSKAVEMYGGKVSSI